MFFIYLRYEGIIRIDSYDCIRCSVASLPYYVLSSRCSLLASYLICFVASYSLLNAARYGYNTINSRYKRTAYMQCAQLHSTHQHEPAQTQLAIVAIRLLDTNLQPWSANSCICTGPIDADSIGFWSFGCAFGNVNDFSNDAVACHSSNEWSPNFRLIDNSIC